MENFPRLLEQLREARNINKRDLAQKAGLTPGYVSHLTRGARNAPSKEAVEALVTALNLDVIEKAQLFRAAGYLEEENVTSEDTGMEVAVTHESVKQHPRSKRMHLREVQDTSAFYGRQQELKTLEQWIVADRSQLVAVLGLGGIGKTTFAAKLAHEVETSFDALYWSSLQDVPPVENYIEDCIRFYTDQNPTTIAQDEERLPFLLELLVDVFRNQRCLLIMDNFESILREGESTGEYRERYEGYGKLLKKIGEVQHKSCLLLTSREKPREIVRMENDVAPVKSYVLTGITSIELQEILKEKGIQGSAIDWERFCQTYSGNPWL